MSHISSSGILRHSLGGKFIFANHLYDSDVFSCTSSALSQGFAPPSQKIFPSQIHVPECLPDFAIVVDDVEPRKFSANELRFFSVLVSGEQKINEKELWTRAALADAFFGLADGKSLIERQREIPSCLENKVILLVGTRITISPDYCKKNEIPSLHYFFIPCLVCSNKRWTLRWQQCNDNYQRYHYLPRLKSH
jgi:hypothetical protein